MDLCHYVTKQLDHLIPDGYVSPDLESAVKLAERQTQALIDRVVLDVAGWDRTFNYLHSMQYPLFLYYLSKTLSEMGDSKGATKLFYLNKILHSLDLYFKISLGFPFLLIHVVGTVFCRADYGDCQVFYQNVLVGVNNGKRPRLGKGLVAFPGAQLIGDVRTGENVVISAGVTVIDKEIPSDVIVFAGDGGKLVFKALHERYSDRYFKPCCQ